MKPLLQQGSHDVNAVQELQACINHALMPSPDLPVDGEFGATTENAVKAFQRQAQLTIDGIVGRYTWSALKVAGEVANAMARQQADNIDKEQGQRP